MKVWALITGLAALFIVSGCDHDEHHHHHHEGYGGSYEGPVYPDYGHGEYRGNADYPDHHY